MLVQTSGLKQVVFVEQILEEPPAKQAAQVLNGDVVQS
jgi:hypothetical protein